MVDIKSLVKGILVFIGGIFFMITTWYIVPTILDVLSPDPTMLGIYWAGLIILWVVAVIVAPSAYIIKSLSKAE